jgi:hypothetical protein
MRNGPMSYREKKATERDKITSAGNPPAGSVAFPSADPPRRTVPGPRRVSLAVYPLRRARNGPFGDNDERSPGEKERGEGEKPARKRGT